MIQVRYLLLLGPPGKPEITPDNRYQHLSRTQWVFLFNPDIFENRMSQRQGGRQGENEAKQNNLSIIAFCFCNQRCKAMAR